MIFTLKTNVLGNSKIATRSEAHNLLVTVKKNYWETIDNDPTKRWDLLSIICQFNTQQLLRFSRSPSLKLINLN